MDTTPADLSHLFAQLGMDSREEDIDNFIASHSLADNVHIANAHFWNEAQREFLREGLQDDSNWSDLIDHLDTLLRK
jgi:hypothetical protein